MASDYAFSDTSRSMESNKAQNTISTGDSAQWNELWRFHACCMIYINICVEKWKEVIATGAQHTNTRKHAHAHAHSHLHTSGEAINKAWLCCCCCCNRYSQQHIPHIHSMLIQCVHVFACLLSIRTHEVREHSFSLSLFLLLLLSFIPLLVVDCAWKSTKSNQATTIHCRGGVSSPLCLLYTHECVHVLATVCEGVRVYFCFLFGSYVE